MRARIGIVRIAAAVTKKPRQRLVVAALQRVAEDVDGRVHGHGAHAHSSVMRVILERFGRRGFKAACSALNRNA